MSPATASRSIWNTASATIAPADSVEEARAFYFEHTHREMAAILDGVGVASRRMDAFVPAPGLKPFLLALKARGIKIALVTSGLYEKAYPEIVAAFRTLEMGDPAEFYDAIITAGFPLRDGPARHAGRAIAQAASVALRRGRTRRAGHPVRAAPLPWWGSKTAAPGSAPSDWQASRQSAWRAATSSPAARVRCATRIARRSMKYWRSS